VLVEECIGETRRPGTRQVDAVMPRSGRRLCHVVSAAVAVPCPAYSRRPAARRAATSRLYRVVDTRPPANSSDRPPPDCRRPVDLDRWKTDRQNELPALSV